MQKDSNNEQRQNIQWFPGHMAKTRRLIGEKLPLIDLVAEIIDARIPYSSRNPELSEWVKSKPRIILLNKCDMADEKITAEWVKKLNDENTFALPIDCKTGSGFNKFLPTVKSILSERIKKLEEKGMSGKTLKVMIVGIPNVGKSSFINRIAGANRAKVENRPGVTRGNQWFMIGKGVEMMDTPGVLWPKFDDQKVGEHLAFCGSVKDTILDVELLAMDLIKEVKTLYPEMLLARYKIDVDLENTDDYDILCEMGKKRGMKISGGDVDTERMANTFLEEFRNTKIGRMTLERP
ncbi:MAG: ribosome biogenesis GTPase YlqF [Acutalibacteraceae bacterium]|nr:ribosome biogenesis GTPase YlqF [Acutalibacteraceae bacterium]